MYRHRLSYFLLAGAVRHELVYGDLPVVVEVHRLKDALYVSTALAAGRRVGAGGGVDGAGDKAVAHQLVDGVGDLKGCISRGELF